MVVRIEDEEDYTCYIRPGMDLFPIDNAISMPSNNPTIIPIVSDNGLENMKICPMTESICEKTF